MAPVTYSIFCSYAGRANQKGPVFNVYFNGSHLCSSHQPFFDSARVLQGLGLSGSLELWHEGDKYPSMSQDIAIAAKRTIRDPKDLGEREFVYASHPGQEVYSQATYVPPTPEVAVLERV